MRRPADIEKLWRGYVAHALFFYRQNARPKLSELPGLGRAVPFGHSSHPPILPVSGALLLRGLRSPEKYWGSLRLGDKALLKFEMASALDPKDPWSALLEGMTHEMQRRYTRAIACLDRAHALAPRWPWPLILRGICRWYIAEFSESARDFRRALEIDPECVPALLFLSRTKSDLRDRTLVEDLDKADRLAPRNGIVLSWRGRAKFVLERTPESLADLKRSAKLLPRYDRSWSWWGISLMELGRVREALPQLKKADRLNPFYPTTIYPLARACMDLGRWDEAGRALERAAAIDRAGIWVEHRISMSHPNPAARRSVADLDRFLAARPKAVWALAWRGQTKLLLRDYRDALADFEQAAILDTRHSKLKSWIHLWRGETWRRLGFFERGLEDFEAALGLDAGLSWAWAGKGFCLLRMGRRKDALAALDRSLELQPRCSPALEWRGALEKATEVRPQLKLRPLPTGEGAQRAGEGDFSPAVLGAYCREKESKECQQAFARGDFAEALRLSKPPGLPGEIRSFLFRGWLKLNTGDAEGAIEEASRALDDGLDPRCAPALWLREEAMARLGETLAAA